MISPTFQRFIFIATALLFFVGCGEQKSQQGATSGKPKVVCTTGQVADMVRSIGGGHFKIQALMGPGVDPHLYRISSSDNQLLQEADLVFYSGLHLEGKMAEVLESMHEKKLTLGFGTVLEEKAPDTLRHPKEFKSGTDPHVWFNAELWSLCVPAVVEKLSAALPACKDEFIAAGEKYKQQLMEVHKECKEQLATIPKTQRVMITAHDAFGYFGEAYDIEVHGLQGISTADQIAPKSQNDLIELLVSRKIKAVFIESSVSEKNLENVIKGCADRGHKVIIGGQLYSDAMGEAGSGAETYVGMMRANLKTIVKALK